MNNDNCVFCRIANGEIPAHFVYNDDDVMAILDINPVAKGHMLVIPKYHAKYYHELPEKYAKKIATTLLLVTKALEAENYNILQNNGKLAGQEVPHVHFHVIPKPSKDEGLGIRFPSKQETSEALTELAKEIKEKIDKLL